MLKKQNCLSFPLFKKVFTSGDCKKNIFFSAIYARNNLSYPRFGIIVSSKIIPSAVGRNFLKRKIRAILRKYIVFKEGFDIVILAKKGIMEKSFAEIEKNLDELMASLFQLKI